MAAIVDLALRAVIDSFEIYTTNFLLKKKNLRKILSCKVNVPMAGHVPIPGQTVC